MKIGVVGDIHWSKYSSIVRSNLDKYSTRLQNCIDSINWAEQLTSNCDMVVYLGDFFDKPELNSMEITALNEINWNANNHFFLVGNHELGINDLSLSSSHIFNEISSGETVDKPFNLHYDDECINLGFIPYVLESNRGSMSDYVEYIDGYKNIVFSHNDIAGIQMGAIVSPTGFNISDIEENCDLFLNGHLHNGSKVTDKIINVGNLTGQNFSEDAKKYEHVVLILDTDTMVSDVYENPYAFNFYKLDNVSDLYSLKNNSVVTIKVYENDFDNAKIAINSLSNVIASRVILNSSNSSSTDIGIQEKLDVNHLDKFKEFVLEKLGNSEIIKEELMEITNG